MKSILYIYHTSSIGGGSFCLLNILKAINRDLYKPIVLLKEDGPLTKEIQSLDIPVYYLEGMSTVPYNASTLTPRKIVNALRLIKSLRNYKKLICAIRPDIVYVNTMMLYPYLRSAKKKWNQDHYTYQRALAREAASIAERNRHNANRQVC